MANKPEWRLVVSLVRVADGRKLAEGQPAISSATLLDLRVTSLASWGNVIEIPIARRHIGIKRGRPVKGE